MCRKIAGFLVVALLALSAGGCAGGSGRGTAMATLRKEVAARHVQSRVFDRNSGLVGPPFVKHCDPPLIAWRSGDVGRRHGYATIYVCQSVAQALRVSVPELPGQRFRSANFVAIVSGDARLARDVQAAVRRAR
jgi:hypothetical protein